MRDIYSIAWKVLEEKIAKSRKQSIHKSDLVEWRLQALEQAIEIFNSTSIEITHGEQEKA
ncbi:hypothetical protein LCGC14_1193690 [marine sediment metagenome]|uniref:HEPN domain-containing protein n=1 Tax=marine sediment metagenome TaxID=412755 RepID=A0A0F9PNY8_9ZZZZ